MSLIADIKKLRELEQKYKITPYDGNLEVYSLHLREHGSAMLKVLSLIRAGDALALKSLRVLLRASNVNLQPNQVQRLERLEQMAALMEEEARP